MKTYTFHVSTADLPDSWRRVELTAQQTLRDLHVAIQEALDWDPDDDIAFFVGENPLESGVQYTLELDEDWDDEDDEDAEDDWDAEDDESASMSDSLPPLDLGDTLSPGNIEEALDLIESNPEVRAQVRQMMIDEMGIPGFMADMMLSSLRSFVQMMPEGALAGLAGAEAAAKDAAAASLESLGLTEGQSLLYMVGADDWRFDVRLEGINDSAEDGALYPILLGGDGPAPEQYFEDEDDAPFAWMWDDDDDDDDDDFEEED